jgi:hypothetical protein
MNAGGSPFGWVLRFGEFKGQCIDSVSDAYLMFLMSLGDMQADEREAVRAEFGRRFPETKSTQYRSLSIPLKDRLTVLKLIGAGESLLRVMAKDDPAQVQRFRDAAWMARACIVNAYGPSLPGNPVASATPTVRAAMVELKNLIRWRPVRSIDVRSKMAGRGFSWATTRRAKTALGVQAAKAKGVWWWRLPGGLPKRPSSERRAA